MKNVILACKTIKNELKLAVEKTDIQYPIIWVESSLHNNPDELRLHLQEKLFTLNKYGRVLMAFGFCGNSILGLQAGEFEIIIPRVSDCISLFLDFDQIRNKKRYKNTYFLTRGWLENERNIYQEYQHAIKKYGEKQARKLLDIALKNYQEIAAIDTGAYDIDNFYQKIIQIAQKLNLIPFIATGKVTYLMKLLTGPYSKKEFVIAKPKEKINYQKLKEFQPTKEFKTNLDI